MKQIRKIRSRIKLCLNKKRILNSYNIMNPMGKIKIMVTDTHYLRRTIRVLIIYFLQRHEYTNEEKIKAVLLSKTRKLYCKEHHNNLNILNQLNQ